MTQVILRVHPVHLMNVEHQAAAAADTQTSQPTWTVTAPLAAIVYIHHRHLYYSARKLIRYTNIIVPWRAEGWVNLECEKFA